MICWWRSLAHHSKYSLDRAKHLSSLLPTPMWLYAAAESSANPPYEGCALQPSMKLIIHFSRSCMEPHPTRAATSSMRSSSDAHVDCCPRKECILQKKKKQFLA
jgi:hypothetical protein